MNNLIANPMPQITNLSTSTDNFVRIETKFLAYRGRTRGIESLLTSYLEPVDGTQSIGHTSVESVYLETPELDFYTAALMKTPVRLKMRIRKYLNTNEKEHHRYLELKYKDLGVSKKKRFQISPWEENELYNRELIALTPHLETLNFRMKRETLYSRVDRVNQIISQQHPQVALMVNYDRKAYEGMGLRITIDENLTYRSNDEFKSVAQSRGEMIKKESFWRAGIEMVDIYDPNELAIIEVKHTGAFPDWLRLGFKNLVLVNDVSFSKYTWCMTKTILGEK